MDEVRYTKIRLATHIATALTYAAAKRRISRPDYLEGLLARGLIEENPELGEWDTLQVNAQFPVPKPFVDDTPIFVKDVVNAPPVKLSWKSRQLIERAQAETEAGKRIAEDARKVRQEMGQESNDPWGERD